MRNIFLFWLLHMLLQYTTAVNFFIAAWIFINFLSYKISYRCFRPLFGAHYWPEKLKKLSRYQSFLTVIVDLLSRMGPDWNCNSHIFHFGGIPNRGEVFSNQIKVMQYLYIITLHHCKHVADKECPFLTLRWCS